MGTKEIMPDTPPAEALQNFAQNIVDTVREPLIILDAALRVRSANRAFYQTFHVSPDETENHLIYELGNGQWDIPALRTLLEDIIPLSAVFDDFELEHDFPSIGRKVMLLNARKLKAGNHGELLVLAMEDVTERRWAEEKVTKAAEDLLAIETFSQNIVDTVREPLLILDADLCVRSANRAFYQIFQVSPGETEDHLVYELGNGQWDIPALRTLLEDIISQSTVFSDFELKHDFPSIGRKVMLLNARQLKAGNHGELLVLAMEDVTERWRAEEAAAQAKIAAEDANRTKSLFLANMSHELRTPLNAVIGYAEILQEDATEQGMPGFLPDLQKIHRAGKHLLSLINDILDLSKIEAGKMTLFLETFNIASLVEEVSGTVRPLIAVNANRLQVQCDNDAGAMHADVTKVRQSLLNLLSNAAKFTKEGNISLTVFRETGEDGEWVCFRVADTGIGMSAEQMVLLFQAFTQADASTTRKFGGTGLGLALTRRFCQLMGGDVSVTSVPGESSAFTLRIPAVVREAEPVAIAALPPAKAHLVVSQATPDTPLDPEALPPLGSSVLVIDDNAPRREGMAQFLGDAGFATQTASGGDDCVRLARLLLPVAITLDVGAAGGDGWRTLSRLKADATLASIPVILLTRDAAERGYALGAAHYLSKPTRRDLARILKKYGCARPPCPVLLVGGDTGTRTATRTVLESIGWAVRDAADGREARDVADRPAVILLDLALPGREGFAFAATLHRDAEWRSIPLVVLTGDGAAATDVSGAGYAPDELMPQVRDLVAGFTVPAVRDLLLDWAVPK